MSFPQGYTRGVCEKLAIALVENGLYSSTCYFQRKAFIIKYLYICLSVLFLVYFFLTLLGVVVYRGLFTGKFSTFSTSFPQPILWVRFE